jgi:hypothetical protein
VTRAIGDFRGIHSGRVFILGNGPSLGDHELFRLRTPGCIGVNRSFKACLTDYLVASDELTFREHREELKLFGLRTTVFATEGRFPAEDRDWIVPIKNLGDAIGWSWDLEKGVYPRFSTYVALQLAVYMGFDDIVLLGTDLMPRGKGKDERGHFFSGGPLDNPWIGDSRFQSECFGYAAAMLAAWPGEEWRVRIVSDACPLRCWPKAKFEEVVG